MMLGEHTEKLQKLFYSSQIVFQANLDFYKDALSHPVIKGNATELCWIEFLRKYLPQQYGVDSGKVIDCKGNESDQVDIVIYNRSMPLLVNEQGVKYFPIEGVCAVFEVKTDLNGNIIKYASNKIASVRKLEPSYIDENGNNDGSCNLLTIIGGLLSTTCKTKSHGTIEKNIRKYSRDIEHCIDFIHYRDTYIRIAISTSKDSVNIKFYEDHSLVTFFLHLLCELEQNRKARDKYDVDIDAYLRPIRANIYPVSAPLF